MQVITILSHIPLWVFAVLAYGLWMGISALRPRAVAIPRLLLLPVVFIALGVSNVLNFHGSMELCILVYLCALAAGGTWGWHVFGSAPVEHDSRTGRLLVPGSAMTLVLFIIIFGVKFSQGYGQATDAEWASSLVVSASLYALSGVATGIALGRNSRWILSNRRATA